MRQVLTFLSTILVAIVPSLARAQWIYDGTRVVSQSVFSINSAIPDGAGGIIIAWADYRTSDIDIRAQRINADGIPLWTTDGVAIGTASTLSEYAVLVSDGAGGAVIAWDDYRNGVNADVYVQRVNASGVVQWTANGVALCTATDEQIVPQITSDGAGGAIVTWWDGRSSASWDVYARRVNSAGVAQWTANGVAVSALASTENAPRIVPDGAGGAIIAWRDNRAGNDDVYAQRINAAGAPQWAANGLPVCNTPDIQISHELVSDGAGGAIVTWVDDRYGNSDVFVQRINPAGTGMWLTDGVGICVDTGPQQFPKIISDGAGGAIVLWEDFRNLGNFDLYAQRVSSFGIPLWDYDGVGVSRASGDQYQAAIVSDGAGGVVATWLDTRGGFSSDIYARRVNGAGQAMWDADGSPLCTAVSGQGTVVAAGDGAGGLIAAWADSRGGGSTLIYAQRAEPRYGFWGRPEPAIRSAVDNPADQGGKVIVRWAASQRDLFHSPAISHYSVWRATDTVAMSASTPDDAVVTDPAKVTKEFAGRAVREEPTPNGPAYWEWIGNVEARYLSTYSYTAPTRQDSVSGNPATHYFQVLAHEYDYPQTRTWESGTVTARSVDNVAPGAPLELAAQKADSDVILTWKTVGDIDWSKYTLYRAGNNGIQPVPVNFLADATENTYTDIGAVAGRFYYIVTATDVHGNEGKPSNVASLNSATGTGGTPALTSLRMLQNSPNPFSATAEFSVGLPRDAEVTLEVYDIAGRTVSSRSLGVMEKGWRKVAMEARDQGGALLPSGVYFYRVRAAGESVTKKMVVTR